MRRDLCYYFAAPLYPVFDAFVQAAKQKFGKNCKIDAYKTISFGLDYSFKYNMNGGSLTVHFMPYQGGTAVDLRYTVVQLMGARYQKHANDVLAFVNSFVGVQAQPIQLDVNQFLAYEANTPSAQVQQGQAPVQQIPAQQPMQQPVQQPVQQIPVQQAAQQRRFCMNCGTPVMPNAAFCTKCGAKLN
ncbi:MAG: zinc ribbon domain-containing protein [Ruminococcus sp.]|nr:zinc ribbon domain-containing protein [Ruminococcus sp.]